MTSHFTGAVLCALGEPLKLVSQIEIPQLENGQVLVQVAYSGICHSQLMEVSGGRGEDRYLPHLLGHEGTGIVRGMGPGVGKVQIGDRVVLGWIRGEGLDAGGLKFRSPIGVVNAGGVTTFSEYTVVAENRLVVLPEGVGLKEGVLFGCAIPTGAGMVLNQIKPHEGSTVAVWGLGGIGLSALMATRAFKCREVIAIDTSPSKLKLAQQFGATQVIDAKNEDVLARVLQIAPGGVDFCVEAAGTVGTIEGAFSLVRKNGGRCVFASHPTAGERIRLDPFDLISGKRIEGSWGGSSRPDADVPIFADLYRRGLLPLKLLVNKTYRLQEINQAMDDLKNQRVHRPILAIHPELDAC